MDGTLAIGYEFAFDSGETRSFTLNIDRSDLSFISTAREELPAWTLLESHRCSICPLDGNNVSHCPIAVNLIEVVEAFEDRFAYEETSVTVTTEERTFLNKTTLQMGLSSLTGIIMATSGCPVMERLKPMVRFHLPFATLEETSFRMTSLFLVAQYFRAKNGLTADEGLGGLEAMYAEVKEVNRCFANRLLEATTKDASVNALVNLDCLAEMIPFVIEDMLQELEPYFHAYLPKQQ